MAAELYNPVFSKVYSKFFGSYTKFVGKRYEHVIKEIKGTPESLLDLCCGTGEFLELLGRPSHLQTTGLDLSAGMLAVASENDKDKNTDWVEADARNFSLGKMFDVVTCQMDSVAHLPEKADFKLLLQAVQRHLHKGGVFIFDMQTRKGLLDWMNQSVSEKEDYILIQSGVVTEQICHRQYSGAINLDGQFTRFRQSIHNHVFDMDEVQLFLKESGFISIQTLDIKSLKPLEDPEAGERVLFVCRSF